MKIKRSALKILLIGSLSLVLITGFQLLGGTHGVSAAAAADTCPSATATGNGGDTMTLTVPTTGTYEIWTQMELPASGATGIYLNVNKAADCFNVGDSSTIPTGSMTWINYSDGNTADLVQVSLTAGSNTIELIGSGGVQVGLIEALSPDSTCNPEVSGATCAPASVSPPTVAITAPSAGSPVNGNVTLTAEAASAPGVSTDSIKQVVFEVNGQPVGTATTAPYSVTWDSTSVANATYPVVAIATDTDNQSTPSATEDITVANNICSGQPSAPTGVTATATGTTTATLSWSAPTTIPAGCTISSYSVYEDGSATAIGNPSDTLSANISDLTPGTQYSFTVSATDNAGTASDKSTAANVTTDSTVNTQPPATAPSAPTGVTAAAVSSTEVDLTWTAPSGSTNIGGYYVYRNDILIHTAGATATSYSDDTVQPTTKYAYKVSAFNSVGASTETAANPASVTTPAALGGSSTTGSSTTGSSTTGSSTTGSSTTGKGSSTTGSSTTGSSTTGKGSSTTGSSTSGKGSSTTTTSTGKGKGKGKGTPPPAPTKPGAPVVSGNGVVITWGRGGHHYRGRYAGWHVYENNRLVVSVTTGSGSGTSVTITGLNPNTKYTFYIVAYNTSAQTSSKSSSFSVKTERRF